MLRSWGDLGRHDAWKGEQASHTALKLMYRADESMREWRIAASRIDVERSSVWDGIALRAQSVAHFWQATWP